MIIGIGRSIEGALALCLANKAEDFLDDPVIAGGIAIDNAELQGVYENIVTQAQIMAAWKAPIAITQNFAVTYKEAEEVIKFMEDPATYTTREGDATPCTQ